MDKERVNTALPDLSTQSEKDIKEEDEKAYGNIFTELESVDLPLGTTLSETLECITEHERILQEIESTDTACVGPTLRSVYDDQPNAHKRFMEKLDARIRNHDREIEKMCNFHHQGFVDAITELLKVRADAEKLMGQVTDTNRRLQEAGREVTAQTEEVICCRIQQRNMATTVERLQLCLPVLEMYSKLKEQLESKRYYAALKTMEQLEKVYIPRVSQYRFCQIMAENLPRLRDQIKEISMSDLKDFLESIRKHSDKVGEAAMKQAQQHRTFNSAVAKQASMGHYTKPLYALNGRGHTQTLNGLMLDDMVEEEDGEEEVLTAQDLVDFSPVYRCLHIYSILGDRETFENYYRKQRKKQARLVLQPQANMHETAEGYRKYFNQIVGFFVVEDHILHATQGLVTRAFTEELWNMALSKVIAVLRTHSSYCDDPDLVLELKNLIVVFADTLQGYGFPVNRLFDLLFEIRDQYNETLLKKWSLVFREIFELDNYSPIPVETEEEYKLVISRFPFHDAEIEKQEFPKKLPMSQSVPQIYTQVKEFIYASLKFSESLHRRGMRHKRVFKDHEDYLAHDDEWLISRFRLPRAILVQICGELELALERPTRRNRSIPVQVRHITAMRQSSVGRRLQAGAVQDGWLLGDSGYPLRSWLLTPFPNPQTQAQQNYNDMHACARVVVERSIGLFKSRWRCLDKSGGILLYAPEKVCAITRAYAILHNMAQRHRIPAPASILPDDMDAHFSLSISILLFSSTEIDDMLRKSTNLLLTRTLSGCLQNLIKKPHIGLTELVQIIINTTHLEQACRYLEEFITNITNVSPETVHTTRLYGLSTFKDARHAAEGEIYTKLNQKIDEFIQLADYEWCMAESDGRASGYLMDLINFLRSTFQVFTHLPSNNNDHASMSGKVAQTACMSACKHLSTSLLQMLMDTELKQISMGAVQQFNLDVIQCELFASSEPVPGFQGDTLQLAFIDLRQLLDLFMVWDWSTYLADYGQPTSKYLRVNPATALALLEKMKDTSKKNNIFSQFRKNDRDKQKLIETVVKQLRSLVNGMSLHS
ncbi:Exocyst complex component 6 [Merluccius polli]|uniref:Exocyst complex component 6 n=1 Tax=Merluccius polli TaxID=89951 RepID=A0AA47P323_MERPO|nr:Exocyst complex component 6 [Merluccius polli]